MKKKEGENYYDRTYPCYHLRSALMKDFKTLYLCNPGKAVTCGKQGCHANSGPCYLTTNQDYAEEKDGKKIIAVSKEEQIYACIKGEDLGEQAEINTKIAISRFNGVNV